MKNGQTLSTDIKMANTNVRIYVRMYVCMYVHTQTAHDVALQFSSRSEKGVCVLSCEWGYAAAGELIQKVQVSQFCGWNILKVFTAATAVLPHLQTGSCVPFGTLQHDVVEAHCYFVDIGRTDREQIRSRINNNDCRTFRPRRPLSTVYKTADILQHVARSAYNIIKWRRNTSTLPSTTANKDGIRNVH